MPRPVIIYHPKVSVIKQHAARLAKHFGFNEWIISYSGKPIPSNVRLCFCVCSKTPAPMNNCYSLKEAADLFNKAIPLTDWSNSNPTIIGEYIASATRMASSCRWWNGKNWSVYYTNGSAYTQKQRNHAATIPCNETLKIEWRGLSQEPIIVD